MGATPTPATSSIINFKSPSITGGLFLFPLKNKFIFFTTSCLVTFLGLIL